MDKKRLNTILIMTFMFALVMLWDGWMRMHHKPDPASTATNAAATATGTAPAATGVPVASSPAAAHVSAVPTVTPKASVPAQDMAKTTVRTDVLKVDISAQGGDIVNVELLQHRATLDVSKNFLLLQNDDRHVYVAQSGLIGEGLPNHKTMFDLGNKTETVLQEGQDKVELRLATLTAQGVKITKVYTFTRGSYQIDVGYELTNQQTTPFVPDVYFQILRDGKSPDSTTSGAFGVTTFTGPAVYTDADRYQKVSFDEIKKEKAKFNHKANDGWIGMVQHYFVTAWLPQGNAPREFYIDKIGDLYRAGVKFQVEPVAPGATVKLGVPLYAGPQIQEKLVAAAPGLDLVVDYGILKMIASPVFWVMQKLHAMLGNWGWTIIVLTIIIKLIFFPLSAASYKSMAKMRLVMPQMTKLKEVYKDDRTKLNQEMMELYKREKINPLGGCLPVIVQIPVFISLYWVLLGTVEIRNASWFWISDLATPDSFFTIPWINMPVGILPILMGATMFFQTRLNPTPPDPIQAKIMTWMPIMFTVMFFWFPSGLVLYWTVNNILSIAQQWYITKQTEAAKK